MSPPLDVLATLVSGRAWVVGGAVRDELLERPTTDVDVAVEGDPRELAHALARRVDAHRFELSEAFGAWRVVARDHSWQVDLLPLEGESIENDLVRRDLTINAIARPVAGGELVDPTGGARDLARGVLRIVAPDAFDRDPLRALRVVRFACELVFDPEPATAAAATSAAAGLAAVAVERVFGEFRRIVVSDRVLAGLDLMDELGLMAVVLPEFAALHGVEQSHFHHLDVHGHTCAVVAETIGVVADPEPVFGARAADVLAVLAEPLGAELDRGQALRFGALLHDIAKPRTREVGESGRVTFFGHDTGGAAMAIEIIRRLRAGERLAAHTSELVRHHLRLGFLVHEMPLSRDAIYGYLSACEPVGVDVTVLSVADRLATRGRNAERAIARHLELAATIMPEALEWHRARPTPPVRGDELVRELGVPAGPELGRLLSRLERESYAGELTDRAQVLARARELADGG